MKLNILIISICLFSFSKINFGQDTTELNRILEATHQKLISHKAISYKVVHTSKIYWEKDTTTTLAEQAHIIRAETDNLLGGYYFLEQTEFMVENSNGDVTTRDGGKYLYDLEYIYTSFPNYLTIEDAQKRGNVPQTVYANFYFIRPEILLRYKNKKNIINSITDKNRSMWQMKIYLPDDEKTRDICIELWIDKEDYSIRRMINAFQYQNFDGFQYDDFQYDKLKYDGITKEDIFEARDSFLFQKEMLDYSNYKDGEVELLAEGTPAPSFEGWNFEESRTVNMAEYLGMPMVLVFWSPQLSENLDSMLQYFSNINNEYAEQGLMVLGLGLPMNKRMDTWREKINELKYQIDRKSLEEYYKQQIQNTVYENGLSYPTLLLDKLVGDTYNVIGFPEIYLIDRNGNIAESYIGFKKNVSSVIKVDIEKLLNE